MTPVEKGPFLVRGDNTEEVTPEAAIRELIATLPTIPIVLREGVSLELVDELRRSLDAARHLLGSAQPSSEGDSSGTA